MLFVFESENVSLIKMEHFPLEKKSVTLMTQKYCSILHLLSKKKTISLSVQFTN